MEIGELARPFQPSAIRWRVGATNSDKTKGMALAYIDARDVMDRLDEVCGPENWQVEYPFPGCARIGIKLGGEWVWKSNGAGATDVEAEKGQYSDAFKRAAVLWNIGRYLYTLKSPWVAIEQRGRSYVIAESAHKELDAIIKRTVSLYIPPGQKAEWAKQTRAAMEIGDVAEMKKLWDEWDNEQKLVLWPLLHSWERDSFKKLMGMS